MKKEGCMYKFRILIFIVGRCMCNVILDGFIGKLSVYPYVDVEDAIVVDGSGEIFTNIVEMANGCVCCSIKCVLGC